VVEAAGIEPLSPVNSNPMMAHEFGLCCAKTFALRRRFDSPGVPYSPLESSPVLEIYIGDAEKWTECVRGRLNHPIRK
jgi:hypothetical protein